MNESLRNRPRTPAQLFSKCRDFHFPVLKEEVVLPARPSKLALSSQGELRLNNGECFFGSRLLDSEVRQNIGQDRVDLRLASDIKPKNVIAVAATVSVLRPQKSAVPLSDDVKNVFVSLVLEDADVCVPVLAGSSDGDASLSVNEPSEPRDEGIFHHRNVSVGAAY